jgi:diacylglycerol kinase (ATP)
MLRLSHPETNLPASHLARVPRPECRRVIISANRKAGSGRRWRKLASLETGLTSFGFEVEVVHDLDDLAAASGIPIAPGMAREPTASDDVPGTSDIRAVLALGGDGTAACVRRHVPLHIPIVAVPMGTENLLARYLGQSADCHEVIDTLQDGVEIALDLAHANGQPFLLMLSTGFDAEVVRLLHEKRTGNINRASYVKPMLHAIRSYKYPELRLYCGDAEAAPPVICRWLFGFNLPLYALGWKLAPQATGTDGVLDVCTFERGSLASAGRYLWHVLRGSHLKLKDSRMSRCRRFRVEVGDDTPVAYQLDGDFAGTLPVEVEVLPGELRLLVNRRAAQRLGFVVPTPAT